MRVPKMVLVFFLVSLVLRLGFAVYTYNTEGTTQFGDDWGYIDYANNMLEQGVFVPDISRLGRVGHLVGPGFPLFLGGVFALFGESYLAVMILNAIISALICLLLYYLGRELFDQRVGILAAGWSVIYVLYVWNIPRVLKHVWLAFLFPLVIYAFILETKREKVSARSLVPAFLYAFLIHMDERFFTYFPLLLVSFLVLDKVGFKNGLRKAVVFFALVVVLMIPWLVRNYYVYDRLIILTERTTIYTDKIFGIERELPVYLTGESKPSELVWNQALVDSILAGKEVQGLSDWRYDNLRTGLKRGQIPRRYSILERWYADFKELWRPFRFSSGYVSDGFRFEVPWSTKHNVSVIVTYGLLLPFFLLGALLVIKNGDKKNIFILLIILVHTLIHVVLAFARDRYRIYIDAFVIIIASYGFLWVYSALRKGTKQTGVSP
jgi:4-amino-4-deoxy-L-arabinose transferase-like glycosyltransferase